MVSGSFAFCQKESESSDLLMKIQVPGGREVLVRLGLNDKVRATHNETGKTFVFKPLEINQKEGISTVAIEELDSNGFVYSFDVLDLLLNEKVLTQEVSKTFTLCYVRSNDNAPKAKKVFYCCVECDPGWTYCGSAVDCGDGKKCPKIEEL